MTFNNKQKIDLYALLDIFSPKCRSSFLQTIRKYSLDPENIHELRIRCARNSSIYSFGDNYLCDHISNSDEIRNVIRELCCGSVYAYSDTIKEGYIPFANGVRAGVVGNILKKDADVSIESITSINIRVPHHIRGICSKVYDLFLQYEKGIIIYSPPSVGKTTYLRDLSIELSRGKYAKKVSIVDTRHEIDNSLIPSDCLVDTLSGYPKSLGIEIATRSMSADVILCDEIGPGEVDPIISALYCGVPLICTAHASSYSELCNRRGIDMLIESGAFMFAVGLSRKNGSICFEHDIHQIEEENTCRSIL